MINPSIKGRFIDIWQSFRSLPLWVQIWVAIVLVPVNLASLLFLDHPMGGWISFLAIIAMAPNVILMWNERGFSRVLALPHLLPWTLLLGIIAGVLPQATGGFAGYLWLLLVTNLISLLFDYPDALRWLRGERSVSRPAQNPSESET